MAYILVIVIVLGLYCDYYQVRSVVYLQMGSTLQAELNQRLCYIS